MTRFEEEWALVPAGARHAAVAAVLLMVTLMGLVFLLPALVEKDPKALVVLAPLFLLGLLAAVPLTAFVLLIGYVWGDARRRGMNHVLWTLLALFVPSGVGIILYFILRDPLPVPCPSCATPARKGHAFCASCGAAVRRACPECRRPLETGWRNCAHCGAALGRQAGGGAGAGGGPEAEPGGR